MGPESRAETRGGKRRRLPSKQKFRPPKLPSMPTKLPLPLGLFEDSGAFDWKSTEKVDHFGAMTFFFFGDQ